MGPGTFNGLHKVAWDAPVPVQGHAVTGYKIYWHNGTEGFTNDKVKDVGNVLVYDLLGLSLPFGNYTIAATAYDAGGSESVLSMTVPFDFIVPGAPTNLRLS